MHMKKPNDNHQQQLIERLHNHEAVIGILGLGYVGLPLVFRFTEVGFKAGCCDTIGQIPRQAG